MMRLAGTSWLKKFRSVTGAALSQYVELEKHNKLYIKYSLVGCSPIFLDREGVASYICIYCFAKPD